MKLPFELSCVCSPSVIVAVACTNTEAANVDTQEDILKINRHAIDDRDPLTQYRFFLH